MQVHFAATPRSNTDEDSPRHEPPNPANQIKSPPPIHRNTITTRSSNSDSSGHSSLSGPSSIDSVLYDDTLIVIEKSNHELELRLDPNKSINGGTGIVVNGNGGKINNNNANSTTAGGNNRLQLTRHRVDTIHNNRHLEQEVIYEDNDNTNNNNNHNNGLTNGGGGGGGGSNGVKTNGNVNHTGSLTDISRSSSQSTLKPDYHAPDHPSLSDLGSIADLSSKFQSLTARKLMAGLSISSIDTLLEVNADAEEKLGKGDKLEKLDESTETIDFGVI